MTLSRPRATLRIGFGSVTTSLRSQPAPRGGESLDELGGLAPVAGLSGRTPA